MNKRIFLIFNILILVIMFNTVVYAESKSIKNDKLWLYFLPRDADISDNTNTDEKISDKTNYSKELSEDILEEIKKNSLQDIFDVDEDILSDNDTDEEEDEEEEEDKSEIIEKNRFNIIGYINNDWKSTTFADDGYYSVLKVDNNIPKQIEFDNTVVDNIQNDINCSFVNNGNFIKIEYVLKNVGNMDSVISLGTCADVQIGLNDSATVQRMNGSMGVLLNNYQDNIQFKFYGKNVDNVTDIDNLWIGIYPYEKLHYFSNNNIQELEDVDTAFSFSWINRTIKAGETQKYSVLIGVGKLSSIPSVEFDKEQKNMFNTDDVIIKGIIKDNDDNSKAKLYYRIDDLADYIDNEYTLKNNEYNFGINLSNLNLKSGKHHIKIWAIDDQGNVSNFIEKDFYITDLKSPILNMSEEWSKKDVKFSISDTDSNKEKVSKYQYKIDDSEWKDIKLNEEKIALDKTGTCTVYIKAIGKNSNEESAIISKIARVDKLEPEVSVSIKDSKIKIDGTDKNSGIDYIEYLINNKEKISDSDEFKKYEKEFSYSTNQNGNLYLHIRAYDKVGNKKEKTIEYEAPKPASIECNSSFKDKDVKFKIVDKGEQFKNGYEYYVRLNGGEWRLASNDTYYDIMNSIIGTNTIETKTVDIFKRESSINKKTYNFETTKNEVTTNKETAINTGTQNNDNNTKNNATPAQTYFIKSSNDDTIAKSIIPKTGSNSILLLLLCVLGISTVTLIKYIILKRNMRY